MQYQATKVIALGDSPNDLSLLEVAHISIVVLFPTRPNPIVCNGNQQGSCPLVKVPHAFECVIAVRNCLHHFQLPYPL